LSILLVAAVNPEQCTPEQVDSYCKLYTKVVREKGDEQIKAPLAVKKRLLVNEKLYRSVCPPDA
jgi:hypothetical protein